MSNNLFEKAIKHFYEICEIPHGSGDMEKISDFCVDFAKKNGLKYVKDNACNVIIYKDASAGYETFEPIILQGHLDMVCQKEAGLDFDFLADGIKILEQGDFLTANGTTLGADNGIAVAIVLTILEDNTLSHPAIEAVFTTDEEIGMVGASALDVSLLKSKKMINIDSEEDDTVTVSCAGGLDFTATKKFNLQEKAGTKLSITIGGLKGGHSGVEIDKHRINANVLMGRVLNSIDADFDLISINGGDKGNAIPNYCRALILTNKANDISEQITEIYNQVSVEIAANEGDFRLAVENLGDKTAAVFEKIAKYEIIYSLLLVPNGIINMSAEIEGLVETSLNLGILKTESDLVTMHFALRSNKKTALEFLAERLKVFYKRLDFEIKTGGFYPPWEYKANSKLQDLYSETYKELVGENPKVEAIHAGLECAVFSGSIEGLDCISIGPSLYDVHTVKERMSLPSTRKLINVLIKMLENCKF